MAGERPLILATNDDGIASPGLRAVVEAVAGLGEVWIYAPREQQSAMGRSLPDSDGRAEREHYEIDGHQVMAYSLRTSPAGSVLYAMAVGLPRPPALVISGINYGENMGTGVTTSGTIGAAIEAACWGIPALAVSLETDPALHYTHSPDVEFQVAAGVTRRLAERVLAHGLPPEVDLLKVDIPSDAQDDTPWRLTRISRQRYYYPVPSERRLGATGSAMGYESRVHPNVEPDSDIYVLARRREISIAPMTIDLTAHGQRQALERLLGPGIGEAGAR